jgi:soluble lytic murein transglycosylase-like protein
VSETAGKIVEQIPQENPEPVEDLGVSVEQSVTSSRPSVSSPQTVALTEVQQVIVAAADRHGVDRERMLRIAKCESSYRPDVVNRHYSAADGSHPSGLFQFIDSTWAFMSSGAGYAGASVFDATANANTAAWAFAHGYASHWECQ